MGSRTGQTMGQIMLRSQLMERETKKRKNGPRHPLNAADIIRRPVFSRVYHASSPRAAPRPRKLQNHTSSSPHVDRSLEYNMRPQSHPVGEHEPTNARTARTCGVQACQQSTRGKHRLLPSERTCQSEEAVSSCRHVPPCGCDIAALADQKQRQKKKKREAGEASGFPACHCVM
jgi:hypothetical protein